MLGSHPIKSWSQLQRTIALSLAEAETSYSMVACSSELLGIQACAKDLGIDIGVSVCADASAAQGIIKRRGVGKLRHIRTQSLWLQEAHATKRIHFEKIDGSRNPSDLLTKHLPEVLVDRHMKYIGALPEDGRAATAPTLSSLGISECPLLGYTHQVPARPSAHTCTLTSGLDAALHTLSRSRVCATAGTAGSLSHCAPDLARVGAACIDSRAGVDTCGQSADTLWTTQRRRTWLTLFFESRPQG